MPVMEVMNFFHENDLEKSLFLAEEVRYLKETNGGRTQMCRAFEEVAFEAKHEQAVDTARNLLALGQMSIEDIASVVKLPVEEVRALAQKQSA